MWSGCRRGCRGWEVRDGASLLLLLDEGDGKGLEVELGSGEQEGLMIDGAGQRIMCFSIARARWSCSPIIRV